MLTRQNSPQRGFTLTEILVAMVITLIGVVMMFQIMESSETRKRTTGAGSDAQTAGAIALYTLERDLRPAGNGFGGIPPGSFGCTVEAYDVMRGGTFNFPLVPVLIQDGAAGAPDQVISLYGASDTAALSLNFNASTGNSKGLDGNSGSARGGLMPGDALLLVNGSNCALLELTDNSNADGKTINHNQGSYPRHYPAMPANSVEDADYEYTYGGTAPTTDPTARYNPAAGVLMASGSIFNLGKRSQPRRNIWQISNGNLTVTDDFHNGTAVTLGEAIVNLQAEYGLDTSGDFVVDSWQATAPGDWSSVIAVRVGLLARSQQFEKEDVTTTALSWQGGTFVMANVDGTPDNNPNTPNNWRRYRYRVYENVIPLRNRIWGGAG